MTWLLSTGMNSGESEYGRIVDGEGMYFILDDGRRLLDASNTGGPLGHRHPAIVRALERASSAPTINDGWLWPERAEAARELVETAFAGEADWVGAVRFFLSGSEANDLALSLSQAVTGRAKLATRERAYHGMTGLARDMTVQPHWHGGLSHRDGGVRPVARGAEVVVIPKPEGARVRGAAQHPRPAALLDGTAPRLTDVAALIVDYTQGGVYHCADYQDTAARAARTAGALWIADEVVTGLGRTIGWFAFQAGSERPDIVTMGKPLGGGGAPAGAVILSKAVLAELEGSSWQTYSTFRGHPLTIAAMRAHLEVLVQEGLVERVVELDAVVEAGMRALADAHPSICRIDGRGLHWTVELHGPDWREWYADVREAPISTRVANRAAVNGVLLGTSGEQTSLFLAPPLIVGDGELARIFEVLDDALRLADEELERGAAVGSVR